mgnify:CR=1 FL=1
MADKREMADTITAWVRQNIRYVAVEHGEYAYRPASPESVLSDKYGDCKGMAALIKDMLCHSGIDGRMVWIRIRKVTRQNFGTTASISTIIKRHKADTENSAECILQKTRKVRAFDFIKAAHGSGKFEGS